MKLIIRNTAAEGSLWAARRIADAINAKAARTSEPFVLGLCTGSTPIGTYNELIRMVRDGEVSFKNVISFNMDEYVGLPVEHPESSSALRMRKPLPPQADSTSSSAAWAKTATSPSTSPSPRCAPARG